MTGFLLTDRFPVAGRGRPEAPGMIVTFCNIIVLRKSHSGPAQHNTQGSQRIGNGLSTAISSRLHYHLPGPAPVF